MTSHFIFPAWQLRSVDHLVDLARHPGAQHLGTLWVIKSSSRLVSETLGRQTTAFSFIVNRPAEEPGFWLERVEKANRQIGYTTHSYATQRPEGERYGPQ